MDKILEVKDLKIEFFAKSKTLTAVNQISFDLFKGQTLGIVGESGCGKSVSALSIMNLIEPHQGKVSGNILFNSKDLLRLSNKEMQKIRGNKMAMIFQEPMTSLNPVMTCGNQVLEVLKLHKQELSSEERLKRVIELFDLVGIPNANQRIKEYPHQLSGGMLQRVMIAMGLACNPDLLIADEPTTALDVTIQAQILRLLKNLQKELKMSIILITHDLGVVSDMCDEIIVMYLGKILEKGPTELIFNNPLHPYTKGLIASIPTFDAALSTKKKALSTIPGIVPGLDEIPPGCPFQKRCTYFTDSCKSFDMALRLKSDHLVACNLKE